MVDKKLTHEDKYVEQIREVLENGHCTDHKRAKIDVYRYNPGSVRVRVIDPDFREKSKKERDDAVWAVLDTLPEDTRAEISLVLLLTPDEKRSSLMNQE